MIARVTRTAARSLILCALLASGVARAQDAEPEPSADADAHDDVIVAAPEEHDDVIVANPSTEPPPLVPEGGVPEVGPPVSPVPQQDPELRPVPQRPPPEPIPVPLYSVEIQIRGAFQEETSFDRTMGAFGYSGTRAAPVVYAGAAVPLVEWLWLGGRIGMRGRLWTHPERESAYATAGDLLLTAQVRFRLGRVVELGVLAGGGAGIVMLELNDVMSDQVVPRFQAEATVAFRVGNHFTLGPRFGWEYFQWEGMNRYDDGMDLGGFFFGLGLEGRE